MPLPETIWSFDLGIASDGEAIRDWDKAHFKHKASLLMPHDLGRRGPVNVRLMFITDQQWGNAVTIVGPNYQQGSRNIDPTMPQQVEFWE